MMNLGKCFITDEFGINGHRVCPGRRRHRPDRFDDADRGLAPLSQAYSAGLSPTSVQRATVDQDRSSAKWGVGSQTHSVPC